MSAAVADTYFAGIDAVAVLIDGDRLRILPVRHVAAGGCLLKRRNAAGDRVAAAFDVFAAHGLADCRIDALPAHWSREDAALVATLPR